ncbi:hypothetical protein HKCCSP123_06120 [Rhodobacterales bacterium HKCCSP123]|nr:hypothetical protein [Rhodobacterales bacterium HKCCSP123]
MKNFFGGRNCCAFLLSSVISLVWQDAKAAEFLLLPGSRTLAILGELEMADVSEFERQLQRGVDEVILSSDGGSLNAAWELGALIADNGLRTILTDETDCASACAILFLHGSERYMSPTARLGVHLPFFSESGANFQNICLSLAYELTEHFINSGRVTDHTVPGWDGEFNITKLTYSSRAAARDVLIQILAGADVSNFWGDVSFERERWVRSISPNLREILTSLDVGGAAMYETSNGFWQIVRLNDVREREAHEVTPRLASDEISCLTYAYQIGAREFLRLTDLLEQSNVSSDFLRLTVETPSDAIRWLSRDRLLGLRVVTE